ncbi:hypothetical protein ZWY2020_039376 [Hordeum vulgare]|nr:hypothetical protein ZWY2020_039376 [Hordeum vulgare]
MVHHPPMDQLQGFEYCIDSNPSWGEAIGLGFQHYILSLGTAVMIPTMLVPLMGGNDHDKAKVVQTLLFVTGIKTLLQTLFGTRLPTVIGGSYAYVVPVLSIIHDRSLAQIADGHTRFLQTMRATQGALIVSSSIQIILGYSQLWAICSRFFSPLGMVPVVSLVGLGLFERIPSASGAYRHTALHTQISCRTDRSNLISSSLWISIPYPLQWGAPTFNADHAFGMMAAVMVSLIESTGAFKAAARLASATPPPAYVLSRGIGWQGIGTLLDGLFGTATGSTVSVENVGLLGSTRIGSRRVIQISAGFMIFFSILGKFGALFASIPFTIFAAIYCVMFGIIAAVGLSFLQFTNMNSMRNLFIVGFSLFLGLSIPEYFSQYMTGVQNGPAHTKAGWFNDYINTIFVPPTVALIIAVVLDNTLDVRDARRTGDAMVGRFRTFEGQQERRVLHPALQPQQVLPTILSKSFQSPGTASRVPDEETFASQHGMLLIE